MKMNYFSKINLSSQKNDKKIKKTKANDNFAH